MIQDEKKPNFLNMTMEEVEEWKNDQDYIKYCKNGDSAAVFITRDIVRRINTSGKWIDVLLFENSHMVKYDDDCLNNFNYFVVELFPRLTRPVYPQIPNIEKLSVYQKERLKEVIHYITWKTAQDDIEKHHLKGYKGKRFLVIPDVILVNYGMYKIKKYIWDIKKCKIVLPENVTNDCCLITDKILIKKLEYRILSCVPLNDNQYKYIIYGFGDEISKAKNSNKNMKDFLKSSKFLNIK